jgi:tRNA pseudouridine38-40 synthase
MAADLVVYRKKKNKLSKAERAKDFRRPLRGTRNASGESQGEVQPSYMSIPFSAEEIAAEERKPKRKVAVMMGYAGTGYHGMQIMHNEKTIEGDVFAAFVAAGAIAKTNADDPKKSGLTRCARTDKGVHAAGNVISLKLIVEDEDIVKKINDHLPEQIRIWGIQRTNSGFSCYNMCDSRCYEYLLPSYSLLPPQPHSYLAKRIAQAAEETATTAEVKERMDDLGDFWAKVEREDIQPIIDRLDPEVKAEVQTLLEETDDFKDLGYRKLDDIEGSAVKQAHEDGAPQGAISVQPGLQRAPRSLEEWTPAELALRDIRIATVAAKRRYRVSPERVARLQAALNEYVGTRNYHNYTIKKPFADPSAKRQIRSFTVDPTPVLIRDTEWLSLKVHGQSFMMHQIRKMVAMAVMLVRCGAPTERIRDSFGRKNISIPKAPSLGLLLERPVFESWNVKAVSEYEKEPIDFGKYAKEMRDFKDRQIYKRMWDVEEEQNV